jgi:ubiquinone/menaquinone biosynthesis C-methylase UbiE
MEVLDIGFGNGTQMQKLVQRGCRAVGVETELDLVNNCKALGLRVFQGCAEQLPFPDSSFDGVICKGVIPFTVEPVAFREIARVLKPGGAAQMCYLGIGFFLRCVVLGQGGPMKRRFYGLRTLSNTWLFAITGRILPKFLGDTVYQSTRRLRAYYGENGFTLVRETPSPTFLGFPVFIYHVLRAGGVLQKAMSRENTVP